MMIKNRFEIINYFQFIGIKVILVVNIIFLKLKFFKFLPNFLSRRLFFTELDSYFLPFIFSNTNSFSKIIKQLFARFYLINIGHKITIVHIIYKSFYFV